MFSEDIIQNNSEYHKVKELFIYFQTLLRKPPLGKLLNLKNNDVMESLMTPEFKNFLKEAITEVLEEKKSNLHNKEILSTNEALEFLGIKKGHLYKLTMDKKIPFSKPTGKMMYFKKSDLIAFQASNFTVKLDGNILASNVNKITQSLKK